MIRKRFQISTASENQATKAIFLYEIFHHPPQKHMRREMVEENSLPPKSSQQLGWE